MERVADRAMHKVAALAAALPLAAAPALAGPAYDEATLAAPCLIASPDVNDFRVAFEAEGWTEPQDTALIPALHALGEIFDMTSTFPNLRSEAEYRQFIEHSHALAEWSGARDRWSLVMTRDDMTAGLQAYQSSPGSHVVRCYLTGIALPGVSAALARPEARPANPDAPILAALGSYVEQPDLPGYKNLRIEWFEIVPPFEPDPPLLAAQSIIISYGFMKADPPEPPQAATGGSNVRNKP